METFTETETTAMQNSVGFMAGDATLLDHASYASALAKIQTGDFYFTPEEKTSVLEAMRLDLQGYEGVEHVTALRTALSKVEKIAPSYKITFINP